MQYQPTPDPAIAPSPDDEAATPAPEGDVWLRYTGDTERIVEGVGAWPPGEVRSVPAWAAARFGPPLFEPAAAPESPADESEPDADQPPAPRARRSKTVDPQ